MHTEYGFLLTALRTIVYLNNNMGTFRRRHTRTSTGHHAFYLSYVNCMWSVRGVVHTWNRHQQGRQQVYTRTLVYLQMIDVLTCRTQ